MLTGGRGVGPNQVRGLIRFVAKVCLTVHGGHSRTRGRRGFERIGRQGRRNRSIGPNPWRALAGTGESHGKSTKCRYEVLAGTSYLAVLRCEAERCASRGCTRLRDNFTSKSGYFPVGPTKAGVAVIRNKQDFGSNKTVSRVKSSRVESSRAE